MSSLGTHPGEYNFKIIRNWRGFCLSREVPSFSCGSEVKIVSARENLFIIRISGCANHAIKICKQAAVSMIFCLVQKTIFVSLGFCDIVFANLETGRGGFHDVGARTQPLRAYAVSTDRRVLDLGYQA
ncbi:hypothetical protein [Mesorhizobium sp.]|uniref:hypothetical protein n=1 Tax=Mesorhizobium sp. TaxID=1871066 RepID=UPI0025E84B01|nr:hypothetical protein [Mesorhizobium sp.]